MITQPNLFDLAAVARGTLPEVRQAVGYPSGPKIVAGDRRRGCVFISPHVNGAALNTRISVQIGCGGHISIAARVDAW